MWSLSQTNGNADRNTHRGTIHSCALTGDYGQTMIMLVIIIGKTDIGANTEINVNILTDCTIINARQNRRNNSPPTETATSLQRNFLIVHLQKYWLKSTIIT